MKIDYIRVLKMNNVGSIIFKVESQKTCGIKSSSNFLSDNTLLSTFSF